MATLPGMSVEFLLTSLVVVLILGTGVLCTVSSSICGRRRSLFVAVLWAGVAYLVFVGASMIRDELSLEDVNVGPDGYLP
jgi:threonine/homoserine/homoserine lactone efflux protein